MKGYSRQYDAAHPGYYKQKGKEKYDPSENKARYQEYREDYLQRRQQQSVTLESRLLALFSSAKKRATKHGIPFTINLEWVIGLYTKQKGKCCLTGLQLTLDVNPDGRRCYMPFSPSLDQIKPGEGYTPENTRLVCVAVNIALNRFGEDVLEQVCRGFLAYRHLEGHIESPPVDVGRIPVPEGVDAVVHVPSPLV